MSTRGTYETLPRATSGRPCQTPGCENESEMRDRFCLDCQLNGKAPDIANRRYVRDYTWRHSSA